MSSSTGQAESRAIADVIQTYFDGLYEGDTEKLARAFHPIARQDAGAWMAGDREGVSYGRGNRLGVTNISLVT
jgi:Putative lumazine-binding